MGKFRQTTSELWPLIDLDLFADDATLSSSDSSILELTNSLNSDLENFMNWCLNNGMVVNVPKTKAMLLSFCYLIFIFENTHQSKHIIHGNLNNIYTNSYNHAVTLCHYFDNWLMNVFLCVIKNISI